MAKEFDQRVYLPKGKGVRLVFEGGSVVDVRNPSSSSSFVMEQRIQDPRVAQREELKAKYPDILLPHVHARLQQHAYQVVGYDGTESASNEMDLMESQSVLKKWMEDAKKSGISNRNIHEETNDILKGVVIGSTRMGEKGPIMNGISTEIKNLVNEVWGKKRKLEKGKG